MFLKCAFPKYEGSPRKEYRYSNLVVSFEQQELGDQPEEEKAFSVEDVLDIYIKLVWYAGSFSWKRVKGSNGGYYSRDLAQKFSPEQGRF